MKAKVKRVKKIILTLSEEQAHMLCHLMQNPVINTEPEHEDEDFRETVRSPLFQTLKNVLNYNGVR